MRANFISGRDQLNKFVELRHPGGKDNFRRKEDDSEPNPPGNADRQHLQQHASGTT